MNKITEYIRKALAFVKEFLIKIIDGIINFLEHVVGWFKSLKLILGKQVPFIAKEDALKDMIKNAPVRHLKENIFEGVYDLGTDEITHFQYLDAGGMDEKTKEILGNEPLVVIQ